MARCRSHSATATCPASCRQADQCNLAPRQYSQADEEQFKQTGAQLSANRLDLDHEHAQHNINLIDEFFQKNRNLPVTVASIFRAVEERKSEFRWLTPAQTQWYRVVTEDPDRANQLANWFATQGKPGQLVNSGDELFENLSQLFVELRGREISRQRISEAEGRISYRPGRKLHYVPAPRLVDPRQKQDDGSMRFTGDFLGKHVNRSPLDYQREREEAAARSRMDQHVNAISASGAAAQREAESLRGNTHSQTDQLQKMFVTKPGTSEIDWPATLNARKAMQIRFQHRAAVTS